MTLPTNSVGRAEVPGKAPGRPWSGSGAS